MYVWYIYMSVCAFNSCHPLAGDFYFWALCFLLLLTRRCHLCGVASPSVVTVNISFSLRLLIWLLLLQVIHTFNVCQPCGRSHSHCSRLHLSSQRFFRLRPPATRCCTSEAWQSHWRRSSGRVKNEARECYSQTLCPQPTISASEHLHIATTTATTTSYM